jgi:hypothetical protein
MQDRTHRVGRSQKDKKEGSGDSGEEKKILAELPERQLFLKIKMGGGVWVWRKKK